MIKTGIDIVEIKRIEEIMKNPKALSKIFNESEITDNPNNLAGKYALKEAFFKATQIKIENWSEILVKKHGNGKPYLVFDKNLVKFKSMDCSISHDGNYAIAIVVIET